jgi:two-component system nitrate/nitrite response regulator NarL
MGERIRVVIADDHPLFREGVRRTLSDFADCEIVAECDNADEALEAVNRHLPDIALLDINMPGGGIEAARRIVATCPKVRIVMLTVSERESDVINSMKVGASGYVLKGMGGEEFATVIKSVHEGKIYISPELRRKSLIADDGGNRSSDPSTLFSLLTPREEQVFGLLAKGMNNRDIAVALTLGERTVKRYMTNIMRKLKVRNRVEAALNTNKH